jgi:hypothetical protein
MGSPRLNTVAGRQHAFSVKKAQQNETETQHYPEKWTKKTDRQVFVREVRVGRAGDAGSL